MLYVIYKVERSEEFQPEKELHFWAFWSMQHHKCCYKPLQQTKDEEI